MYPQAYLEQCKYKLKKKRRINYIDVEIIDYDSENDRDNYVEIKNDDEIENIELFR